MATRARIGIQQPSGRIMASYQHWDGYPGGLGYTLINHWTDVKKVTKGIQLGGASKWGQIIGDTIDFDDRQSELYDVQNVYYMRDRGEKDQGPSIYKNEAEYLKHGFNSGEEYIYLMKQEGKKDYLDRPQGTWYFAHYAKQDEFFPLERRAILDHIESWKQHLEEIA